MAYKYKDFVLNSPTSWAMVNGWISVMKVSERVKTRSHHLLPLSIVQMAEAPTDASVSSQIDPIPWAPSHWTVVTSSWKGFSEIRYLFILYVFFALTICAPSPYEWASYIWKYSYSHNPLSGDSYSQTFGRLPWFVLHAQRNSAENGSKGFFNTFYLIFKKFVRKLDHRNAHELVSSPQFP